MSSIQKNKKIKKKSIELNHLSARRWSNAPPGSLMSMPSSCFVTVTWQPNRELCFQSHAIVQSDAQRHKKTTKPNSQKHTTRNNTSKKTKKQKKNPIHSNISCTLVLTCQSGQRQGRACHSPRLLALEAACNTWMAE